MTPEERQRVADDADRFEEFTAAYYGALLRLRKLVVAVIVCTTVPLAVVAGLAIRNTVALREEGRDTRDTLRGAGWRGCARDNNERAEQQVNGRQTARLPGIRQLFSDRQIEEALRRRRERLPLLNCDPLLCGGTPTQLTVRQHELYLRRFEDRRIPALASTPDTPWRCDQPPYQLGARAPAARR